MLIKILGILVCIQVCLGQASDDMCLGHKADYACNSNCTELYYCTSDNSSIIIEKCDDNKACSSSKKSCVKIADGDCQANSNAPPGDFICTDAGEFPNIGDKCASYFICAAPNKTPELECKCGENEIFDPTNRICGHSAALMCPKLECSAVSGCTEYPPINSPNINSTYYYYICTGKDKYLLFFCPQPISDCKQCPTKSFIPSFKKPAVSCTPYVPLSTTTTTTTSTTTSQSAVCSSGNLVEPGPTCDSYYNCSDPSNPRINVCSEGLHFNLTTTSCMPPDCLNIN